MAVIDRVLIRGIRSFGPESEEKVKFSTPLTLLLGQNGCGKTTVIESVKYALTGEFPAGTDNGKGFVNDPKMSNRSTTKSSVKVRITDSVQTAFTVGKFMEVSTQAGGKLKFKSISPTVRVETPNGGIQDMSGRCLDINAFCAQKLNVSKAIINNVIFCHQENASWPLEEAKKLKEKFDEIFGSTEYNKCIDKLRKLIKEKRVEIRVLNEQVNQKLLEKRNTEKLRESVSEKEVRLENVEREIEQKRKEIEPIQKRLDEINHIMISLNETQQKVVALETRLKGIAEHQEALMKHLVDEFAGSDEELELEIVNFGTFQLSVEKEIQEKESKRLAIDTKMAEINHVVQKRQVLFGELKQEEAQQQKRCKELEQLIEKAKVKYDLSLTEEDSTDDIIYKLKNVLKGREIVFERYQKLIESQENQLQTAIDGVRSKLAASQESFDSKTKQINDANEKIKEAKIKLNHLALSNCQLASIEKKITEAEQNLAKRKSGFDEGKEIQELENLDAQVNQMESNLNKLDKEYRLLQKNYVIEQKIDTEKVRLFEKRFEIENINQKHEQDFEELFGDAVPQDKLESSVKTIQKREEATVKSLTTSVSTLEKDVASLEAGVKHVSEKLQSHKNELLRDKNKIESVCKGTDFSQVLNQSYTRKEKLQKDKGAYRSAKTLFEQFISQFEEEKPCCPVCTTDFSSKRSVVPNIINTLKKKIEDLPRKLQETDTQLKKEEDLFNKLQQLKPVSENIKQMEGAKIPRLEEELQEKQEKLEDCKLQLVSIKQELLRPQALVDTCRKVIFDAALLDRLNAEIKRSEQQIETFTRELIRVPSNRTLTEAEAELTKVKSDLNNLRREHKTKRDLFDETKEQIQDMNERLQTETKKKLLLQSKLQELPLLEKMIKEYERTIAQLKKDKIELTKVIAGFKTALDEALRNKQDKVVANKKQQEEHRSELLACRKLTEEIDKLHAVIQKYTQQGVQNKLETTLKELDEFKNNLAKLEETKKILNNAIEKSKKELASQEGRLRFLNDNKDLRSSRIKSRELESDIRQLKQQIGIHSSSTSMDERRKGMQQVDQMESDINRRKGEADTLKDIIKTNRAELNKKEHRESSLMYKKKFYDLKVEEAALKDLELYTEVLEMSVLKFHKERMVRINMTIRELWRDIYKGNDIDHIEIKTSDELGSAASKRRSYSYKVVQVKKGTELDMRGRCSAGQKVLACLVIRMALAETFSTNCGILALDEPTTNLDRDNIMSLCDALSRIIASRQNQKNFQLIIITHDEDFLRTLTRDQSTSHYYKVQRNADGFSFITREVL